MAESRQELLKQIEEAEAMMASLDSKQLAEKILINALYGAQASPYFRFFDFRCAEGITTTGQYFIQRVAEETSAYIDGLSGVNDSLVYIDTDSNYFCLDSLLDKVGLKNQSIDKLVESIDTICEKKIGKQIEKTCHDIGVDLNTFENHLVVKREKISQSGIWVAKKRYAILVRDDEGLRYKEPKISVTGLEVKRSSTPKMVRDALTTVLDICLKGKESDLQDFVKQFKEDFVKADLSVIAIPSGVKGLEKYHDTHSIFKQGCPQHVRATLIYNHYLRTHRIMDRYNPILEGGKMKRVPLMIPNPLGHDVIGFNDRLPEEFGVHEYIDYEDLFDKTFLAGAERVANAIGWQSVKKSTLDDFFG